jgi:hypothetical protein
MSRAMALVFALAGCAGVEPVDPPLMGANEMQQRPGLFSGPDGDFVIAGSDFETEEPGASD